MRQYLLTEQEKKIIKKYLETGEKLEGFNMLVSRCRHMQPVKDDLSLIDTFLNRVVNKPA